MRGRMGRLLAIVLLLLGPATVPVAWSQNDPASRQAAIAAVYPAMLAALEAGNIGHARHLCDQVILWEPANPAHQYNLACIEAGAGASRLPYAFAALEQSIRLGFNDADHLQSDPDLQTLRTDPRFAELVRRTTANATAGAAIAAIVIPEPFAPPIELASMPPEALPSGLFLATPANQAWFFSPDGRVFQNPRRGINPADLSSHRGLRGSARLTGTTLAIGWNDGRHAEAAVTRRTNGLAWNDLMLSPAKPFARPADAVGAFVAAAPLPDTGEMADVPRQVELRADESAIWISAPGGTIQGRWDLRGFSLRLIEADGTVLRLLAFPLDSTPAPAGPRRIFLGGAVFHRP